MTNGRVSKLWAKAEVSVHWLGSVSPKPDDKEDSLEYSATDRSTQLFVRCETVVKGPSADLSWWSWDES